MSASSGQGYRPHHGSEDDLEGARVEAVFELLPYSSGLPRNIQQCLNDYGIPLFLSTTVTGILGKGAAGGRPGRPGGSGQSPFPRRAVCPCDTLLLSVGLIPENELTRRPESPWTP